MPGPVDTWVRLLHNLWSRPFMRAVLDGDSRQPRAFFALNTTRWLGERAAGHSIEQGCRRTGRARCVDAIVSRHWWWPFANNTRRPKAKAAGLLGVLVGKGKRRKGLRE